MKFKAMSGLLFLVLAVGCGGGGGSGGTSLAGAGGSSGGSGGSGSGGGAAPVLVSIDPDTVTGGQSFGLDARGSGFAAGDSLEVSGQAVPTTFVSDTQLSAAVPGLARGTHPVRVRRGGSTSGSLPLVVLNTPPEFPSLTSLSVDEDAELTQAFAVSDFDGDALRVLAEALPPGATWDPVARRLDFRPDFIQGGKSYTLRLVATDGEATVSRDYSILVNNTIQPPWPTISQTSAQTGYTQLTLTQKTDDYLDSPGRAGRNLTAKVTIPSGSSAAQKMPVRVFLHGLGGSPYTGGSSGQFRIYAHDPENTYWWGYSDQLPNGSPTTGQVFNYTQRRVLHLLEWVLENYPGADPERVYIAGSSMGGAGAATLGLMSARHFCYVEATLGQKIPRNHRPARLTQLESLWGTRALNLDGGRGMGVWDFMDLTRVLKESPEARQQFIHTKHGKDDATIHFGAAVLPSPLTGASFYEVLQSEKIGHYCVWDEGGHGTNDPIMGGSWWDGGWDPVFNATTYLRRNLAFPAFSGNSLDRDPGSGGNGNKTWSNNSGYAGTVSTAGDTGWDGDIAGTLNRSLRWNSQSLVDTLDRFEVELWVLDGTGQASPKAGYPTKGDKLDGTPPAVVSVTPRRSTFRGLPGESLQWSFGSLGGTATAAADGSVTIPDLPLEKTATWLRVWR